MTHTVNLTEYTTRTVGIHRTRRNSLLHNTDRILMVVAKREEPQKEQWLDSPLIIHRLID